MPDPRQPSLPLFPDPPSAANADWHADFDFEDSPATTPRDGFRTPEWLRIDLVDEEMK